MLTPITSPVRIRKFLVYDLEWVPGTLQIRLVGVYDGERYRCYRTIQAFIENELTSKNRGKWFYAHAGGLADVQFVLEEVIRVCRAKGASIYKVNAAFSGSSAIITHVNRGNNSWHFIDSYWLLRDKLKNIGKSIGIAKGLASEPTEDPDEEGISDDEYERRMANRRRWFAEVPLMELRDYNEIDCVILWKAINRFETELLEMGGQLQMTVASCAMQLFRRRYLSREIETNEEVNQCARLSYFASRVEVFQHNVKDAYYYDINSSFPYAMTHPLPGEYLQSIDRLPDSKRYLYLVDCEVEVADANITPIPYRIAGRVFFPVGSWRSWFTSVDLELLQREGGKIRRVHEVMVFEPFYDLAGYVKDIFAIRKASKDEFKRLVLKYVLNSLYGKFGEWPEKTSVEINPSKVPITIEDQQTMRMRMLFPGAWLKERTVPVPHMHVPISTHVTAIARRTLFDFLTLCREFHYCDTDGFSTTENLGTTKDLGGLKLEKKIEEGHFVASKLYRLKGEVLGDDGDWKSKEYVKGKGFSRLTASRFAELLEGEAISFERMMRIRERYAMGLSNPVEHTYLKRIKVKSVLDKDFDPAKHSISKRFMYPDGTSRPWHLDELRSVFKDAA